MLARPKWRVSTAYGVRPGLRSDATARRNDGCPAVLEAFIPTCRVHLQQVSEGGLNVGSACSKRIYNNGLVVKNIEGMGFAYQGA